MFFSRIVFALGAAGDINPAGKVYGLYALSSAAEPLLRRTVPGIVQTLWHSG